MFQPPRGTLVLRGLRRPLTLRRRASLLSPLQKRNLLTLAIETSCDDTSVAILERHDASSHRYRQAATLHFLENITADSTEYRGIHPLVAHESHQDNLARLVNKALQYLPPVKEAETENDGSRRGNVVTLASDSGPSLDQNKALSIPRRKPDFISVTRGPGMRANLLTGLDTAKGLAVAWQVPLVGVHHMQAHLLTPRLVGALSKNETSHLDEEAPDATVEFPFLSILVSGGHTLLVHSSSAVDHSILAETIDIAIGDAIDKFARLILPQATLSQSKTTMYGKLLEEFAFPNGPSDYADYIPPATRKDEIFKVENAQWGWSFGMPLAETRSLQFSFSGILSNVEKQVQAIKKAHMKNGKKEDDFLPHEARVALSRDVMRVFFEHLASRTVIALESLWEKERAGDSPIGKVTGNGKKEKKRAREMRQMRMRQVNSSTSDNLQLCDNDVRTLVVSGGVAANRFLLFLLRSFLDVRGFKHVKIVAPPPKLCTDNAAMIGWAGMEMFERGWRTDLSARPLRKWALDKTADDGGILGPDGWVKEEVMPEKEP
ncbi:hypothetical protein VTO42DRAFT_1111 [Malbranchea cinnamomea]